MNIEGVDYILSHSRFNLGGQLPVSVSVKLLNDGVVGEEPETIILTLVQDRILSLPNVILSNEAITITLQDNECMLLNRLNLYHSESILNIIKVSGISIFITTSLKAMQCVFVLLS